CPYEAASIAIHGANWPRYLRAEDLPALASTPGVRHAAGVLMSATTDPRTAQQQIWLGVDDAIRAVKPFWKIDGRLPTAPDEVLAVAAAMRRREPDANVVPMAQLLQSMLSLARTTRLLIACVVLIALLISAFGVVNAVLASVFERTGEIGMLRAVGASRGE